MSLIRPTLARIVFSVICCLMLQGTLLAQPFVDACFTSPTVGTSFAGTANVSNNNADLLRWTGSAWTGGWGGANITLAPPGSVVGTRAIWSGDGTVWTTGGEGFGLRLTSPIVTGTTYTFNFERVSHGTGQNGSFRPILYTNTSGTFGTSYGNIPTVGTTWASPNISFTATAASSGHTFIYFHNQVGSGMFLACTTVVLPMAFSQLKAFQAGDDVQLDWLVQNEETYVWHVVERSLDGQAFAEVGRVPSVQASDEGHRYAYADPIGDLQHDGALYYRIRSVDTEGKDALSPIVMTRLGAANEFETRIFPNPASKNESPTVEFYAAQSGPAEYQISDMSGRVVRKGQWLVEAAHNVLKMNSLGLQAGTYVVQISAANQLSKVKLFLQ